MCFPTCMLMTWSAPLSAGMTVRDRDSKHGSTCERDRFNRPSACPADRMPDPCQHLQLKHFVLCTSRRPFKW